MAYRVAICDDSQRDAEYVLSLLTNWAKKNQIAIQTECFPSAESFLFHYAEDKTYDILLLDIEMGKMDGVTMAREPRHRTPSKSRYPPGLYILSQAVQ